jgi:hypothetical protein
MNVPPEKPSHETRVRFGLFLAAFFCALVQLPLGIDAVGFGPQYEASTVAQNLAATGTFRDPFGMPTGPTALYAASSTRSEVLIAIPSLAKGSSLDLISATPPARLLAACRRLPRKLAERVWNGSLDDAIQRNFS